MSSIVGNFIKSHGGDQLACSTRMMQHSLGTDRGNVDDRGGVFVTKFQRRFNRIFSNFFSEAIT